MSPLKEWKVIKKCVNTFLQELFAIFIIEHLSSFGSMIIYFGSILFFILNLSSSEVLKESLMGNIQNDCLPLQS